MIRGRLIALALTMPPTLLFAAQVEEQFGFFAGYATAGVIGCAIGWVRGAWEAAE